MSKEINLKEWALDINEHVASLHDRDVELAEEIKELRGAVDLLSQNKRALWDTIDLLRDRINRLESSIRNSKRRCWPWS